MRCEVCGRGPMDGVTVYRVNPKGEAGVWACKDHRLLPADPEVQELVDVLESPRAALAREEPA